MQLHVKTDYSLQITQVEKNYNVSYVDSLYQVWLKLAQWFLRKKKKMKNL